MVQEDIVTRYLHLPDELRAYRRRIEVQCTEDIISIGPSEKHQRNLSFAIRAAGASAVVGGVLLVLYSGWFLLLTATGAVALALGPRFVTASPLLHVNAEEMKIVVQQRSLDAGLTIALSDVRRISGQYEIYGWEPRSVIYADTGSEKVPVLVFSGTNEKLARFVCSALGFLLEVPSFYTGSYGETVKCSN